ncbi:hypothetical protein Q1695_000415 [Nippostrongylus brasiliensis]|nr:hypothetical protein Q1695_000415 [Nippostrongylus brasiliensis]
MRSTRAGAARRAAARTRASRPYVDDGNDDDVVAIDEPAGPAPSRRSRVRPRRQNTRESESSAATDEEVVILDDDMQDLDLPIATRRGRRRTAGYVIDAAASTRGTHGLRGRAEQNGSLSRVRGINRMAAAQGNGDVLREYQSRPFNLTPAPHPRRLDGETFSEVKNVTAMCGKWLIVVLVSRSRSNWALPSIPLDIVDRFHVVQFSTASRYGRFLADSYHVDSVPAAIIIDPRSGEGLNIIQDLSSGEHDVPQMLEEFVRENPNYAARDEYVRRIFNPHLQFDQDNGDLPPNEPSPRKRPSNSSAKSPKRSKMDVGGDDGLSDETRSLTMTDKDEWKTMAS